MIVIEYFALDLGDRHAGLIRRIVDDVAKTDTIESVQGGKWVDDPILSATSPATAAINSTSFR